MLGAIDGRRTLAEILSAGTGDDAEERGLGVFKRLWYYDQIVFHASAAAAVG